MSHKTLLPVCGFGMALIIYLMIAVVFDLLPSPTLYQGTYMVRVQKPDARRVPAHTADQIIKAVVAHPETRRGSEMAPGVRMYELRDAGYTITVGGR